LIVSLLFNFLLGLDYGSNLISEFFKGNLGPCEAGIAELYQLSFGVLKAEPAN
jgi:hypothetical protein